MIRSWVNHGRLNPNWRSKRSLNTRASRFHVEPKDDFIESRVPVLVNDDLQYHAGHPPQVDVRLLHKNADADEVIFIHEGSGKMNRSTDRFSFDTEIIS